MISSHMVLPINQCHTQLHMDGLQFCLFYEAFGSAELCKVLGLTTKMSPYSVIIALSY